MAVDSTPKGVFSPTSSDCRGHRIIFTSYISCEHSCPLVGGHVFLEEATPIGTEMVHGPTPCQHNTQILVTVGIRVSWFQNLPIKIISVCTSTLLRFIWITVCMICSQVAQCTNCRYIWHNLYLHLNSLLTVSLQGINLEVKSNEDTSNCAPDLTFVLGYCVLIWPSRWFLLYVQLWGLWWNCKCAQNRTSVKYSKSSNRSRSGLEVCKEVPLKAKFKIKHGFAFISFFILCVCLWTSFMRSSNAGFPTVSKQNTCPTVPTYAEHMWMAFPSFYSPTQPKSI